MSNATAIHIRTIAKAISLADANSGFTRQTLSDSPQPWQATASKCLQASVCTSWRLVLSFRFHQQPTSTFISAAWIHAAMENSMKKHVPRFPVAARAVPRHLRSSRFQYVLLPHPLLPPLADPTVS